MKSRRPVLAALFAALTLVTGLLITTSLAPPSASAAVRASAAAANTAVTTFKNDNERDGDFSNETTLNESNVNVNQFGKRVQYSVDGQVYAEPLFLPNLSVNGATHNVVFVATENDSVYAFDADATSAVAPLWKVSLLPGGATAVSNNVSGCGDLTPVIGITGTPVIDSSTGTMFVVSYDTEGGNQVYRLHALNVLTGADKWPAIVLSGTVPGTGVGSSGGNISFNPNTNRERPSAPAREREGLRRLLLVLRHRGLPRLDPGIQLQHHRVHADQRLRRHPERERRRTLERQRRRNSRRSQRQHLLHKR
jgi:hypothetical protein